MKDKGRIRAWWRKRSRRSRRKFIGALGIAALLLATAALSVTLGPALWEGPLNTAKQLDGMPAPTAAAAPEAIGMPGLALPDDSQAVNESPTLEEPSPTPSEPFAPAQSGVAVWIPQSGSRYHADPTCSGMRDAAQVSLEEAKALGFAACQRCHPPE